MTTDIAAGFDPARIADPGYFADRRLPAHSDHRWFASADEASSGASGYEQCLNGTWKFHYATNPDGAVPGFWATDFDASGWDDIAVPGHLQLQGYGRPQYTNVQYPWDGLEQVEPGQVPTRFNPVGSYRTTFTLDRPLAAGERLSVSFGGAESAVAVWLNGVWVGYGADSFTPSEFDLTTIVVAGENVLAVQVFTWSSGSWIEDQDFFRFSGLFRDVVLHRRPAVHVEDLRTTTTVAGDLAGAEVEVRVDLVGSGSVRLSLAGVGALADAGGGLFRLALDAPRLWSAEDPYLYQLAVEVLDPAGNLVEYIPQQVGVRRFGIEDGVLAINGRRLVFNGVNRHEFGLQGRVMTREQTEADVRLMKAANINAIRTSHYPNNSFLYELCDRYGLYVVDEMNLESHGLWDRIRRFERPLADAVPGDKPEWLPVLLDRAANMLERDKNHACIVLWSCGNESFGGTNILAVADWFRSVDTRPVHYEGVHWDPRYPQTTDVASQMYTPAAEVEAYLATHRDKPFLMCEYAHAMGNSFGAVDGYVDLAWREPLFQGGFIWDFADQAIPLVDRHGVPFFGYGGDSGEAPHDYDFSGNGILFADHTPKPILAEVAYLYQPLAITVGRDEVVVENRHQFTDASTYRASAVLAREGRVLAEGPLQVAAAPGESVRVRLPFALPAEPGEYTIDVGFVLREDAAWAPAGHLVARGQGVFSVAGEPAAARTLPRPELVEGIHNVGVRGARFRALFSRLHGGLTSYRFGPDPDDGRELLQSVPVPNFWHAPTSNERGWHGPSLDGQWLLASRYPGLRRGEPEPAVTVAEGTVEVRYAYALPTVPASECDVAYRVSGDGRVEVTVTVRPGAGLPDMPEFGMLFTTSADLNRLRWYGEGPHECYVDRRGSAALGLWETDVTTQLTPYLRPQEAGSHTGVRWASVTDERGAGLRFDAAVPMEFSALPWTPFEVENALHPIELPPIQRTVLRPALMRRGVGGDDAWGARTHPEYLLPAGQELVFRFAFQGIG